MPPSGGPAYKSEDRPRAYIATATSRERSGRHGDARFPDVLGIWPASGLHAPAPGSEGGGLKVIDEQDPAAADHPSYPPPKTRVFQLPALTQIRRRDGQRVSFDVVIIATTGRDGG